jgi:threonine dehydrogenase-like Zn-dependent dehydrogenase
MKAVVVEDANRVVIREVPCPEPRGPYDAVARVICASLCNATDAKIVHRQFDWVRTYPTILGHEAVGRVMGLGPMVRNFRVGDLVSRPHAAPLAESGLFENWGGFAEYGLVTDTAAMAEDDLTQSLPVNLSAPADFDPAAFSQMVTLRETLAFLTSLGVRAGDTIVIFGTGPVGLSFSLLARQLELDPVIVVGRRSAALERALSLGRATHVIDNTREPVPETIRRITGAGADWAIEAIGTDAVLADAIASLKDTGQVGLYGVAAIGDGTSALRKSDRVKQPPFHEAIAHQTIMDWVGRGLIPAREFITHELPLEEVAQGLQLLERKEAFKVLLWMDRNA